MGRRSTASPLNLAWWASMSSSMTPPRSTSFDSARQTALGGSPQLSPHPSHQLAHREGLGHVVVGSELEPGDLVRLGVLGGEHDDRDVRRGPDLAAHIEPGHPGEHQVEQDQVGLVGPCRLQPADPGVGNDHVEPLAPQGVADRLGQPGLVLYEQDAVRPTVNLCRHPPTVSARLDELGTLARDQSRPSARRSPPPGRRFAPGLAPPSASWRPIPASGGGSQRPRSLCTCWH